MKKEKKIQLTDVEKILQKLTGGYKTDKKILIDGIYFLKEKSGDHSKDIAELGEHLYKLLLENGLNESDIINKERLFNKVEGLLYEKRTELALDILEVLDAVEPYIANNENGEKIYYVNTLIDASLLETIKINESQKPIKFEISPRGNLLSMKASIYLDEREFKKAQAVVNEMLKLNPADFEALQLQAEIFLEAETKQTLENYRKKLLEAHKFAYTTRHLAMFLTGISQYYERKKDFLTAYACLVCAEKYMPHTLLKNDMEHLKVEINKTRTEEFKDMNFAEASRIMKTEKIPYIFDKTAFKITCMIYYNLLVSNYNDVEVLKIYREFAEEVTIYSSDDTLEYLEKTARKQREREKAEEEKELKSNRNKTAKSKQENKQLKEVDE